MAKDSARRRPDSRLPRSLPAFQDHVRRDRADKSGPRWAQVQSLNMLTCTEGKERTPGEYETLLQYCDFVDVQGCRTSSPLDAVLAVKRQ